MSDLLGWIPSRPDSWILRFLCLIPAIAGSVTGAQGPATDSKPDNGNRPLWRETTNVHGQLPKPEPPPNLSTPQAAVEYFVRNAKEDNYHRAAYSLNFEILGNVPPKQAATLAEQLYFVLNQKLWIDWEGLPDRRDGQIEGSLFGSNALAGKPQRNIELGKIDLQGRLISIRVHRVKPDSQAPVWLFSGQTVENIPQLYEAYGPGWLQRNLPVWATQRGPGRVPIWQLVAAGALILIIITAGIVVGWLLSRTIRDHNADDGSLLIPLLQKMRIALPVALVMFLLYVSKRGFLRMTGPVSAAVEPILVILLVSSMAWLISAIVSYLLEHLARGAVVQHSMDESDEQRRMLTQVSVAKRVIRLIVIVVAIGVALLELSLFESVGIALLASAGAGGVILGLAGQTVLGNLLAGLQIAITRPFRISDSVFIEDNWGRIENVTYTYVIIRTWDHRRLIFPVRYFLEHYIENWSKTNRFLVKPIYLHVDYRLDVQTLREKFFELLRDDEDWTETEDSYLAVTDTTEETMVVRLTCGAADPSTAWYLAIRIREHIIAWLQEYHDGRYLPRQRVQLVEQADHNEMNASAAPEHDQDER